MAQNAWTSRVNLSNDTERRKLHNKWKIFKWWSNLYKLVSSGCIDLRNVFAGSPGSSKHEIQTDEDHPESTKQHVKRKFSWKTCTLEKKEILNDRFMFCKFKTSDSSVLELGRKVILCSTDDSGKPMKEEFFPSLFPMDNKHFGIVSRIGSKPNKGNISELLSTVNSGDELAYKPGQNELQYRGKQYPIRCLTIIAAGIGIIPVLNILKKTLGNMDFNIERCELLWINDSKEEFIFNNEVEKLEKEFEDRFLCARVLDVAIGAKDSILNQKVRDSLPFAEPGRVAIVAAPSIVAKKFKPALDSLAYSTEDIISIHV
jgi:NAD(P)H-flavin reductase